MKKKVKISASWCTPQEATQRLLEQFKTSEEDCDNIEFVYDDSYDIIIGMNYFREEIKPGAKAYLFPHEPSWSGSHLRFFGDADLTCFGYRKDLYHPQDKVVELPAHTFYGGRGRWMEGDDWTYEKVLSYEGHPKTKNISSCITTLSEKLADTCLYPERSSLVKYLIDNKADFIDFYGGWLGADNLKHDFPRKLDAVLDYRFCLSFENEHMDNWISEKFYDCILTGTVPIYFGCKNIRDIWGAKGYILIEDVHDHEGIYKKLQYINEHADEIYRSMISDVQDIKKLYFYKYNPLRKINQLSKW